MNKPKRGPGRPPKPPEEKQSEMIRVYYTEEMARMVKSTAALMGKTPSALHGEVMQTFLQGLVKKEDHDQKTQ